MANGEKQNEIIVMAAANIGTFLGGLVAYGLRLKLTEDQIFRWGWRIPFLSGILISFCGLYLKYFCTEDEGLPGHGAPETSKSDFDNEVDDVVIVEKIKNPKFRRQCYSLTHLETQSNTKFGRWFLKFQLELDFMASKKYISTKNELNWFRLCS